MRVAEASPARTLDSDAAFEEIYVAAWPRLCRYAWVLVRHHEDAEDVAAETVRKARSRMKLRLNMVLTRHNYRTLPQVIELAALLAPLRERRA